MSVQQVIKNLFETGDEISGEDKEDIEDEANWYEGEQNDQLCALYTTARKRNRWPMCISTGLWSTLHLSYSLIMYVALVETGKTNY